MSWIHELYKTYELCAGKPQFEKQPLNPISSLYQHTQIQITLDGAGAFRRAEKLELPDTLMPVSEESASRSSGPCPHPLTDKLSYCAADISEFGEDGKRYDGYQGQLREWCNSEYAEPKACAVLRYVEKKTLTKDLIREGVLRHEGGKLSRIKVNEKKSVEAKDAWIRWRVEIPGDPQANTWEDEGLFQRWADFEDSRKIEMGTCAASGERVRIARLHPRAIRHNGDGAKLVTSNDERGFTYRGRFGDPQQAAALGYEISQKAHNALRWLVKRQGARFADQVFVAWAVNGVSIPDPLADTAKVFEDAKVDDEAGDGAAYQGDAGQHYALRLRKAISGYRAKLGDADEIVVMGLDSATPGRMAITFYRELTGSEFLGRVADWHASCAWFQNYSENHFVGAPAPREIAEAAYGRRLDDKLRKSTVERLLPCIIDARPLPRDLVAASVRRVSNRVSLEKWEWERYLGIVCALVRGSSKEENYQMALEEDRTTRDYLFGRLLAIAENIEERALHLAKEKRDTTAARLMQRFADHPCSAWRNIELALTPYKTRLRANRPAVLLERDKLLDSVIGTFREGDFISDGKLSGEFLLGYHCQRQALWAKGKPGVRSPEEDESAVQGEEL